MVKCGGSRQLPCDFLKGKYFCKAVTNWEHVVCISLMLHVAMFLLGRWTFLPRMSSSVKVAMKKLPGIEQEGQDREIGERILGVQLKVQEGNDGQFSS